MHIYVNCRLIDDYCLGPGWKMKRQDLFSQYIGRGVDNRIIQICETAVVLINWLPMPPHHELRGEVIFDRKEWRVMSSARGVGMNMIFSAM